MLRCLVALGALVLAASVSSCAEDPQPSGTTTVGAGGAGGSHGSPSAKPACEGGPGPTGPLPDVRADSAAALSPDGRTLVMFGGDTANVICPDIPPKEHVGDTWVLDVACGEWTKLEIAGPSPRSRHAMVSDPARERALLFGGRWRPDPTGGSYTLYDEVWAFDFATQAWSQLAVSGTPPAPRYDTAMVVDGDELVVFGGGTATSATSFDPVNDTFALDLTTNAWRQIQPGTSLPAPRLFHAAAYDPVGRRMFVAYGADNSAFTTTAFFQDVWALDLATETWHELMASQPAEVPYGRIKGRMSFRAGDGDEPHRLFVFAGHDDAAGGDALGNRNDVLSLELPAGVASAELGPLAFGIVRAGDTFNAPPSGPCDFPADFVIYDLDSPERRSAFALAPTADGEGFVVFAGDSDCDRLGDAWWFDTRAGVWEPVRASLPGLTCPRTNGGDVAACNGMCG